MKANGKTKSETCVEAQNENNENHKMKQITKEINDSGKNKKNGYCSQTLLICCQMHTNVKINSSSQGHYWQSKQS